MTARRSRTLFFSLPATLILMTMPMCGRCPAAESEAQQPTAIVKLLAARCLECHSGAESKGGLNLSSRDPAAKGGDSGAVIVAGQPDQSLLWHRVRDDEMPPKHPLADDEKTIIRDWLTAGAVLPEEPINRFQFSTSSRGGYDWWSLQPLRDVELPAIPAWTQAIPSLLCFVFGLCRRC